MEHPEVIIYTDGAASGNPGPGGYGAVLMSGRYHKELTGGYRLTTNNRMELMAVIVALEALKIENSKVTVYTDSLYIADAVNKGWLTSWVSKRFKGKKNPDLWMRFLKVYKRHQVQLVWIKGHNDNPLNERCDKLAVQASMQPNLPEDTGYQPA
jgi:ribonuclease HI